MKTKEEIKAKLKELEREDLNTISYSVRVGTAIDALKWVLEIATNDIKNKK